MTATSRMYVYLCLTTVVATLAMRHPVAHAAANLGTPTLQKAAVACQKVIAQASAKVRAGKLRALDACANMALTCVQTKQTQTDCLAKAAPGCAKKLAGASAALAKAQAKIVAAKSCAGGLRLPDLLGADGLGFGEVAGSCQSELGLDVCLGLEPLATCLVRTADRTAGVLYGDARPRAGELLAQLPGIVPPAIDGLPTFVGCGACSAAPEHRKAVEQCGKAITKATQTFTASLAKTYGTCAQKVLACVQTKAATPACLTAATAGCDKSAGKLAAPFAKLAATVGKKCDASVLPFDQLAAPAGLHLAVADCTTPPTSADGFAACLQQRARCATTALARETVARTRELADDDALGALGPELTAPCPTPVTVLAAPHAAGSRAFFGSILKFLKKVRRPNAGLTGVRIDGPAPPSGLGANRGVRVLGGPTRFAPGGVSKIPFRYLTGRTRRASAPAALVDPPTMIVSVRRTDVVLDDHFEIPLDPNPVTAEVDDELEVTYEDDDLPACAFTLTLATRIDGVVSDYTPVLQVQDLSLPTTSPTATLPTPTPTFTPGPPIVTEIIDATGDGGGKLLDDPFGIAVDGDGNVYVAGGETDNVFQITPGGTITEIIDASGDGGGNVLNFPVAVVVDSNDNVFVAGGTSSNVFKITPLGVITEVIDASGDGGGNTLSVAFALAIDTSDTLYVTGANSDNVFKITPGGTITEIIDATGDGGGNTLDDPEGVAVDGSANVYVTGRGSNNAFKITAGGTISEILDASGDGAGNTLAIPQGVAVDGSENVYVGGLSSDNVFKITPGGTITQIADASGDGAGTALDSAFAVATDATGNLYVAGAISDNVFVITPGGSITRIADANGDGAGNGLDFPSALVVDGTGTLHVSGATSDNAFTITLP